ncbi:MAG TPA: hypothetical protein P5080_02015 [Candidatus Paceibacterota bacterium]|nr:hypothetical protein [Candidatus Paceibacterota bacterium]HSA36468.1 hypothetical protein [Candidatus Paceibacterota bacterium]
MNDKNAMIKAYKERNGELNNQNQELKTTVRELKGTVAALIKQRDEAIELARKRGEELEDLRARVKKLERPSRAAVPEVSAPEGAVATVRAVTRPTARKEKELPLGQRVQAAVAHFLRDWELSPREPMRVAWDAAYHINGILMNEGNFSLDEILAAVDWLKFTLGEKRHSVEGTRKYLAKLDETEEGDLQRAAQCELAFLNLVFPPEQEQQKTNDGRVEATA